MFDPRSAVRFLLPFAFALALFSAGCDSESNKPGISTEFTVDNCTIPTENFSRGCDGPDCIPALSNPDLTTPRSETVTYLADTSRVIGLLFGDEALAIPHNVLWFHEVVNFDSWADRPFAVTYCPLTGTSLAFDRTTVNGAELRVSGLLYNNNLVMYDRQKNRSLWPQMNRAANCGANVGTELSMLPVVEVTWRQWRALHPQTNVVSSRTGHAYSYAENNYPYGDYEQENNDRLLYDMGELDDRRPPKERVLGIPNGDGGLALPFGQLANNMASRVISVTVGGENMVVFWDRNARSAMAYRPGVEGQILTFQVNDRDIVDAETGSRWAVDGRALEGEYEGTQLEPVNRAYVSFWFAWAAFHPETRLWPDDG